MKMFAKKIDRFRKKLKLSIPQFCKAGHIQITQYRRYLRNDTESLLIKDAVMLMASFPEELNINSLLGMMGSRELLLGEGFPSFGFSNDPKHDYDQNENNFRKFYYDTAFRIFKPLDAIELLAAMTSRCNKNEIWLPMAENMYYLMYSLRNLRKLKLTRFEPSEQTVLAHFQRRRLVTRFIDLCEYERAFDSGGLYLLSELMYLNERRDFGIKLIPPNI